MATDMNTEEITRFQVSDLAFDVRNPRLAEFEIGDRESDLIKVLWETMDVRELVLSIAASGYFEHEPVIVVKEEGRNVVIEGNRRLAAVKLLLSPTLAKDLKANVPTVEAGLKDSLREIPALLSTRKGAWRYLGFKHVNGPAKWGSYAKSQYIADVHRTYGVPLDDIARQLATRIRRYADFTADLWSSNKRSERASINVMIVGAAISHSPICTLDCNIPA